MCIEQSCCTPIYHVCAFVDFGPMSDMEIYRQQRITALEAELSLASSSVILARKAVATERIRGGNRLAELG